MAKSKANPFPGLPKREKTRKRTGIRRVSPTTFIAQSRRVSSEQKAMFHNILGAGPKGTIRKFFDLNRSDESAIRDGLEKLIGQQLRRA